MTVRTGEKTVVETFSEFHQQLAVSAEEMAEVVTETAGGTFLALVNEERADNDEPPLDDLADAPEHILVEACYERVGATTAIFDILENRSQDYIVLPNGVTHTIVELNPPEESAA
jgi:hypothetical protein